MITVWVAFSEQSRKSNKEEQFHFKEEKIECRGGKINDRDYSWWATVYFYRLDVLLEVYGYGAHRIILAENRYEEAFKQLIEALTPEIVDAMVNNCGLDYDFEGRIND